MTRVLFVLCLIPAIAAAAPYDGVYKPSADVDCATSAEQTIVIENGILKGIEMQCRMTRPVNVVDMDATLYTMQCSGEGQNWTERAMLMRHNNNRDVIMLWDGFAFVYEACAQPSSQTSE